MTQPVAQPSGGDAALAPGTIVGGRFKVESEARRDRLGIVLRANDQKTGKPIALRVAAPGLMDAAAVKVLRAECRTAASLSHRNLATTFGVGTAGTSAFVASEWIDGRPLSEVIAKRRSEGGHMSLRGAYNVIAHVCRALTAAQPKICHGALRPSVVWVTEGGRVKVADLGVGRAVLGARGASVFSPEDQACLAPEVKAGATPTASADIFGIGAILYVLLTGKSPADGFVPPSQAHPDGTEAIDRILLTCLAADPAARFASPDEVRAALQPLAQDAPVASAADDFGFTDVSVEVDIDVEAPVSELPPAMAGMAPIGSGPNPKAAPAPQPKITAQGEVGQRMSLTDHRASMPDASSAPTAGVDLGSMLAKITENDAARWMVVKDGLDHGPFAGRELVEHIVIGEVLEDHVLLNMDTGERRPVKQWPDFKDFVEQQRLRASEKKRRDSLDDAERSEKRSGMTKLAIGGALLVSVLLAVGVYFATRVASTTEEVAEAEMGDLFAHGQIELEGTTGILPDPPSGSGMRRGMRSGMGGGGGGGGGAGFAGSYENAMSRAVDIGSASGSGGQGRLSPAQVTGVMNRHVNRIYNSCVRPEEGRGGRLGNVTIDVAIGGNGAVQGVSARQGSAAFKSCVQRAVRSVRFPTFGAPRMGARYSFDAS